MKNTNAIQYDVWSRQYLTEAENLRERVDVIREEARRAASSDEADRLAQRASLLYGMYLDCFHTGRLLAERGGAAFEEVCNNRKRRIVKKEHMQWLSALSGGETGKGEGAA